MTTPIDRALAKARLQPRRPYTDTEMAAAKRRLTTRLADRVWRGCLSFDDRMEKLRHALPRQPQLHTPRPGGPQPPSRAARDLRTLCRTLVSQDDALHQLQIFVSRRLLDSAGALILGCVLQLATREDSARFWWQFAAGAGDTRAAYCLALHHRVLGELREAEWWQHQATPREDADRDDILNVIQMLGALQQNEGTEPVDLPATTTAVIDYVPDALDFVDEVDLPLPELDFRAHIEELSTA
ncbi:hypothetical protein [Streptomyces malaysiensis]|uniref:hypothetical protein n=1 Tax=Streptomyces malaysiensis TaxID=92644 RepID=UPI000852A78F|nr:hypothetical protein [Streptomyces sp. SPMA113]